MARVVDEEEGLAEGAEADDDAPRTPPPPPKPRRKPGSDVYTGMLFISLLFMILGSVMLYLDYSRYQGAKPPKVPDPGALAKPAGSGPEKKGEEKKPQDNQQQQQQQ